MQQGHASFLGIAALMFVAGIGIPLMATLNAGLGRQLASPAAATFILYVVGLALSLGLMLAAGGLPSPDKFRGIGPHFFMGAVFVVFYIVSITWAGPTHGLLCAESARRWFESTVAPYLPGGVADLGGVTFLADALAANVVIVGETVLWQGEDCPAFAALRAKPGLLWRRVNMDELAKADGALTCCSVIFP